MSHVVINADIPHDEIHLVRNGEVIGKITNVGAQKNAQVDYKRGFRDAIEEARNMDGIALTVPKGVGGAEACAIADEIRKKIILHLESVKRFG